MLRTSNTVIGNWRLNRVTAMSEKGELHFSCPAWRYDNNRTMIGTSKTEILICTEKRRATVNYLVGKR